MLFTHYISCKYFIIYELLTGFNAHDYYMHCVTSLCLLASFVSPCGILPDAEAGPDVELDADGMSSRRAIHMRI